MRPSDTPSLACSPGSFTLRTILIRKPLGFLQAYLKRLLLLACSLHLCFWLLWLNGKISTGIYCCHWIQACTVSMGMALQQHPHPPEVFMARGGSYSSGGLRIHSGQLWKISFDALADFSSGVVLRMGEKTWEMWGEERRGEDASWVGGFSIVPQSNQQGSKAMRQLWGSRGSLLSSRRRKHPVCSSIKEG